MHYTNAKWAKSQRLTFEVTGRRRQDALARTGKMYRVPRAGPRWPAVGAPVDRRVRPGPRWACEVTDLNMRRGCFYWPATAASRPPLTAGVGRDFKQQCPTGPSASISGRDGPTNWVIHGRFEGGGASNFLEPS